MAATYLAIRFTGYLFPSKDLNVRSLSSAKQDVSSGRAVIAGVPDLLER